MARAPTIGLLAALLLLAAATPPAAREFRSVRPIVAPAALSLPAGARRVEEVRPLARTQIEAAAERVIARWNTEEFDAALGDRFYDRTRLLDALDTVAPRDATLRLLSVQAVQTLEQYIEPDPEHPERERLVNLVSATVHTQLEFEAPGVGLVRRRGVNELLLRIIFPEQRR